MASPWRMRTPSRSRSRPRTPASGAGDGRLCRGGRRRGTDAVHGSSGMPLGAPVAGRPGWPFAAKAGSSDPHRTVRRDGRRIRRSPSVAGSVPRRTTPAHALDVTPRRFDAPDEGTVGVHDPPFGSWTGRGRVSADRPGSAGRVSCRAGRPDGVAREASAMGLLDGKKALIFGVANDHSIAWGIAQALHAEGAFVGFSSVESLHRPAGPPARRAARVDLRRAVRRPGRRADRSGSSIAGATPMATSTSSSTPSPSPSARTSRARSSTRRATASPSPSTSPPTRSSRSSGRRGRCSTAVRA